MQSFRYKDGLVDATIMDTLTQANPHVLSAVTFDEPEHANTFFNEDPMVQSVHLYGT